MDRSSWMRVEWLVVSKVAEKSNAAATTAFPSHVACSNKLKHFTFVL